MKFEPASTASSGPTGTAQSARTVDCGKAVLRYFCSGGVNPLRIALIQMNSRAGARDENVDRAVEFVVQAAGDGAEIVVLPEFFNVEYFPQYGDYRYMDYAETQDGVTISRMREAARTNGVWLV